MSEPDNWIDEAIQRAQTLGKEHGHNAAGWWIQDALTNNQHARQQAITVLKMDEDCEAQFPMADLSGEFADGVLPKDVFDYAFANGGWDGDNRSNVADDAVLHAYEEAFDATAHNECIAACKSELA
jgi:hypothetical protein